MCVWKKIFLGKKTTEKKYAIVFCDEYDLSTEFHQYCACDTYKEADHIIRMSWPTAIQQHYKDGYKVEGGWIIIKPI